MKDDSMEQISILVIDDEQAIRQSYTDFLEDMDYQVHSANNGRIGLEIFNKEKIDIVLVDLRMPEIDGLEVLSVITKKSPEIPLIVVSGTGVIGDAVEALREGAWDYLLKPIKDFSVLLHAVEMALEKARLKNENLEYQKHLEKMVADRTAELENKAKSLEREISIRKDIEERIRKSLKEKDVLLQEIHHRVKNNMAIISSFLNLKAATISDLEIKQMFKDSQQRIKSMALVHEKLYHNEFLANINVGEYFSDLLNDLVRNYHVDQQNIDLAIQVDDLSFSLDLLIPIGLMTNEIITNSFKHAFAEVTKPEISIELHKEDNEIILLKITDNGPGFKIQEKREQNKSIGLMIIKALIEQIDGQMSVNVDRGVEYNIRFPLNPNSD